MTTQADSARDRILRIAAKLFVDHGFRGTTIRRLCDEAQVNVSMVNYYFHSKEDLYHAAVAYAREQEIKGPDESALAADKVGLSDDKICWFDFPVVSGGKGAPTDTLGGITGWLITKGSPKEAVDFLK